VGVCVCVSPYGAALNSVEELSATQQSCSPYLSLSLSPSLNSSTQSIDPLKVSVVKECHRSSPRKEGETVKAREKNSESERARKLNAVTMEQL